MSDPPRNRYQPGLCVCIPVGPADLPELPRTLRSLDAARRIPGDTQLFLLSGLEVEAAARCLPGTSGAEVRVLRCQGEQPLTALRESVRHAAPGADVLFLRPGMQLPRAVDCRLRWAAYRNPRIGIATPISTQGRSLVVPSQLVSDYAARASLDAFDRFLLGVAAYGNFSAAAPHPGCFYLRRQGLELLCRRPDWPPNETGPALVAMVGILREAGLDTVICDHVPVAGSCSEEPGALAWIEATEEGKGFLDLHPLAPLASRAHAALSTQPALLPHADLPLQPVILHLGHSWGGGLDRWISDYIAADRAARHLVLKSIGNWGAFGQTLVLHAPDSAGAPIEEHGLGRPIRATEITHTRYRDILADIIQRHAVDAVFVSSLIGHAFDALEFDLPTVLICHDYYPFCPALNITFGGVCTDCSAERLAQCFADNEHNRFFLNVDAGDWLAIRERYATVMREREIRIVAPSASVMRNLHTLDHRLRPLPGNIIPHGAAALPRIDHPKGEGAKLRILLLGHLTLNKGKRLLLDALPALAEEAELYLVGCNQDCDDFRSQPGVAQVVERYERETLADMVGAIDPDLGLLLSVVPETFSYTLSELAAMGVPVLATRIGSFEDRIKDGENGFLCAADADSLRAKVHVLNHRREILSEVRERIAHQQATTPRAMVAGYWALVPLHGFSYASYGSRDAASIGGEHSLEVAAIRNIKHMNLPFAELVHQIQELVREKIDTSPRFRTWQRRLLRFAYNGLSFSFALVLKLTLRARGHPRRRSE